MGSFYIVVGFLNPADASQHKGSGERHLQSRCVYKIEGKLFSLFRSYTACSFSGLREDYRILAKVRFKRVKAVNMNELFPAMVTYIRLIIQNQARDGSCRDGNWSVGPTPSWGAIGSW